MPFGTIWTEEEDVYFNTVFLQWVMSLTVSVADSWRMGEEFWNREAQSRNWPLRTASALEGRCKLRHWQNKHCGTENPVSQLLQNVRRDHPQGLGLDKPRWSPEEVDYLMENFLPWLQRTFTGAPSIKEWEEAANYFNAHGSLRNWQVRSPSSIKLKIRVLSKTSWAEMFPYKDSQTERQSPELADMMYRGPTNNAQSATQAGGSNSFTNPDTRLNTTSLPYNNPIYGEYPQVDQPPTGTVRYGYYTQPESSPLTYNSSTSPQYVQPLPYQYTSRSSPPQQNLSQSLSNNPMSLSSVLNSVNISPRPQQITTSVWNAPQPLEPKTQTSLQTDHYFHRMYQRQRLPSNSYQEPSSGSEYPLSRGVERDDDIKADVVETGSKRQKEKGKGKEKRKR